MHLFSGLVAILLLVVTGSVAQTIEERPLYATPISKDVPPEEHILYRVSALDDRGFNRVIDQVGQPTITIYRPVKAAHRNAAVVIIPGGGYQFVVIDREGHMIARFLQKEGITAVVLKYRLPNVSVVNHDLPLPQEDALAAIRFVREHATEFDVDPKRVGVMGFSAGGHLAGSTAVFGKREDGSRPDFVTLVYPVVTLAAPLAHEGSRKNLLGENASPERIQEFSLEKRANRTMPPFFLTHARDDTVVKVENTEMLAAALKAEEVPVELMIFSQGRHGFALGRDREESTRWPSAFLNWLDRLP